MMTGAGLSGRMKAYGILSSIGVIMAGKPGSFLKKTVDRFLPDPGQGPTAEQREAGFWSYRFIGLKPDGSKVIAKVKGDRDPGYGSTSKMLGEAAVCLALDKSRCPEVAGLLTPATALADPYIERLESNAGLSFEIVT